MQTHPDGRLNKLSALSLAALLATGGLLVLPLAVPVADAAVPAVQKEWHWDTDCNGHLDAVTFLFQVAVQDDSVRPSDFTISQTLSPVITRLTPANGFTTGPPTFTATCAPAAANQPSAAQCPPATANDPCFTLYFPEGIAPDTGPTSNGGTVYNPPSVQYNTDPAAQLHAFPCAATPCPASDKMSSLGACAVTTCKIDSSAPRMMAAYAKGGDTFLIVTFTENVAAANNALPALTDFCVFNGVNPVPVTTIASVPASSLPNRGFRLGFAAALPSSGISVRIGAPCTATMNILDPSGNPAAPGVVQAGNTACQTSGPCSPFVSRVYGNAGDPEIVVEFNGPVWDGTDDIDQVSGIDGAFSVVGAGSGLTGLLSNGAHVSGGDRIIVNAASTPPNACDALQTAAACGGAAGTGAHIRLGANEVFGFKASGVNAPATASDIAPLCAQNPPTPPAEDVCLADTTAVVSSWTSPRVKEFITRDTDSNGCLDAIQLLWNENILDSSYGSTPAGLWTVVFPQTPPTSATNAGSFEPALRFNAVMRTDDPFALTPSANDAVTYLTFQEACTFVDATVGNPYPYGNTGMLPRVSFCDGNGDAARADASLCTAAGANMPTDLAGNPMRAGSNGISSFLYRAPTVDGAKPVVTRAMTADDDRNGYIDHIDLTISEGVGASTVTAGAWTATLPANPPAGCPLLAGTTWSITSVVTTNANKVGAPTPSTGTTDAEVELVLAQKSGLNPAGDTGCVPDLTYSGGITEATDRYYKPTPTSIGQSMNNIVAGPTPISGAADSGTASTLTDAGAFGSVTVGANLAIVRNVACPITVQPCQSRHTVIAPVTANTITFTPALASGTVAIGDLYSVNCPAPGFMGGTGPMARNVLCETDGGQPIILGNRAESIVGSNVAYITFSEPVFGSSTTLPPATCGVPSQLVHGAQFANGLLAPADLLYDDNSNGGVNGISAVSPVGNDCRRWQLTLNGALSAADVAAGDCITIRIPTSSPGSKEGVRDAMPAPSTASPPSFPGIGNIAYPFCVPFTAGTSPVSAAETLDSDHDGTLDAIKVTFTSGVTEPFGTVAAGDSDIGALVQAPSGFTLCRVGIGGESQADRLYAHQTSCTTNPPGCSGAGTVCPGDFRYTDAIGIKAGGQTVLAGDGDVGATLVASGLLRVPAPGAGSSPNARDNIYFDADGTGSITVGDFRYSGYDGRHWTVSLNGVPQVVSGVRSGLASSSGTATGGSTTTLVDATAGVNFINQGVTTGSTLQITSGPAAGSHLITGVTATTLTFPTAAGSVGSGNTYTIPLLTTHTASTTGAPTGRPCHDSGELLPNVANDAILFVCFEEQRDSGGKLVPNTGVAGNSLKVSYAGSTVLTSGTPVSVFFEQTTTDSAQPVLVSATSGAGLTDVALLFSEPVQTTSGTKITPSELSYVNGNPGSATCVNGATSIASVLDYTAPAGSAPMTITVRTDKALSVDDIATDVTAPGSDGTAPLSASVIADGVHATCTVADSIRAIPSLVREITNTGTKLNVWSSAATFTDDKVPTIASAGFIDANGDGIIDAVQVKFNEFIADNGGAACGATTGSICDLPSHLAHWGVRAKRPDNSLQTLTVTHLTTGQLGVAGDACQNTYSVTAGTGATPAPLRLVPYVPGPTGEVTPLANYGRGIDDDYVFLCLDPDALFANGGTKDKGTALAGELLYTASSAAVRIKDSFAAANALADLASNAPIVIQDMARPAILNNCRAQTVLDRTDAGAIGTYDPASDPVCPANMSDESVQTNDRNGDGIIDSLRVKFSEPVKDSTFQLAQWSLSGKTLTGISSGTVNDDTILLLFTPGSVSDTGLGRDTSPTLPDLGYFAGGSMSDNATTPNLLRGLATGACPASTAGCADERDGAPPVVAQIAAQPGTNLITIRFSERVGTGANGVGAITTSDLSYVNGGTGGGASGINAISHTAGSDTVTLTLNGNLQASDIANDKIAFTPGNIKEDYCGPGASRPATYLYPTAGVPNSCYRELNLGQALCANLTCPTGIKPGTMELEEDEDDRTETSVKLTWDDPVPSGNPVKFILSYCPGDAFFAGCTEVDGADVLDIPATANERTVTGLTTGSTYTFVIQAEGESGQLGDLSDPLTIPLEADDTDRPCAVQDLEVLDTTASSVKLSWTVPHGNCDAEDGAITEFLVAVVCGTGAGIVDGTFQPTSNPVTFTPTTPPSADSTQIAEVKSLLEGEPCLFAVKAQDDGEPGFDTGDMSDVVPATPGVAGSKPGKVLDLQALAGDPASSSVKLLWTAPSANTGKVTKYRVLQDGAQVTDARLTDITPPGYASAGASQSLLVTGLAANTEYSFEVRAVKVVNGVDVLGDLSDTVTRTTATAMDAAALNEAIRDFAETVDLSRSGSTNTIKWGEYEQVGGTDVQGVLVWKLGDDGRFHLLRDIKSTDPEFDQRAFSETGNATDQYKATVYYGPDEEQGYATDPSGIEGFADLHTATVSAGFLGLDPIWWIAIAAGVLLLIVLIVVLLMRGRKAPADMGDGEGDDEEAFESIDETTDEAAMADAGDEMPADAPPEDLPLDTPAAAAPVAAAAEAPAQPTGTPDKHYLTCPKCATEFSAFGVKPLAIQCPNCGVRGTLR